MDRDGTNLPHPSSLFIVRTMRTRVVRTLQELCCLNISQLQMFVCLQKRKPEASRLMLGSQAQYKTAKRALCSVMT